MIPRTYSSKGFVLARKNYSEADRILTIYSQKYGKVTLLAKGIRKIKSRKRGHLEIFSEVNFSASIVKGFDILTEAQILNDYKDIRASLKKVSLGYYFCEVVSKITREGEPSKEVYSILDIVYGKLQKTTKLKTLRFEFIYRLLTELGYWPKGKKIIDADQVLENVLERGLNSVRVGKKMLV